MAWFAVGYLIVVAALVGFAFSIGATIAAISNLTLVLIIAFVIAGVVTPSILGGETSLGVGNL